MELLHVKKLSEILYNTCQNKQQIEDKDHE